MLGIKEELIQERVCYQDTTRHPLGQVKNESPKLNEALTTESIVTSSSEQIAGHKRKISPLRNLDFRVSHQNSKKTDSVEQKQDLSLYFTALWRNKTSKKHKTWEGDGVVLIRENLIILYNSTGKHMSQSAKKTTIEEGAEFTMGGKDVCIESSISKTEFLKIVKPVGEDLSDELVDTVEKITATPNTHLSPVPKKIRQMRPKFSAPLSKSKTKTVEETKQSDQSLLSKVVPRYSTNDVDAVVFPKAPYIPSGCLEVPVVLDPRLRKVMRPHQIEGVIFLYKIVVLNTLCQGSNLVRSSEHNIDETQDFSGAILADEMGLGKTLQIISLVWTLLKQKPYATIVEVKSRGNSTSGLMSKILIVTPVTLIANWKKEFQKWLGNERVGIFVVNDKANLRDFTVGKIYNVMMIGYEKLRLVKDELCDVDFDLIVCDEGHRLKNAQNKSASAIKKLNCPRRILLSGTPIQNDLQEFFVMTDFVNPGLLGTNQEFKKKFEDPIIAGRQPHSLKERIRKSENLFKELQEATKPFVLRRTAEILREFIPPKSEYIVFCRPTGWQKRVYETFLKSGYVANALDSVNSGVQLQAISILRKISNAVHLFFSSGTKGKENDDSDHNNASALDDALRGKNVQDGSGKLRVLISLLSEIRANTDEKVVVVSNFTKTIDLIEDVCRTNEWNTMRLDGQTPPKLRQGLVDRFNRTTASDSCNFNLNYILLF